VSDIPSVFKGQDWTLPVQVLENSAGVPLTGKTVTASVLDATTLVRYAGPVACDPSHLAADFGRGKVVPVFLTASHTGVPVGPVLIQIDVDGEIWARHLFRVEGAAA
jgi:hypothetical protein